MSATVLQRQQLWKKYSETKDPAVKEQLILNMLIW